MSIPERHKLYQDFLAAYPLEKLPQMTLTEYTNLVPNESFCNWVEAKAQCLGSIWGSNAYKFGIFMYKDIVMGNDKYQNDDTYAWYARFGADNAAQAFEIVKKAIVEIATAARNHDLEAIEKNEVLTGIYKWKIAFLYSNEWLVPIYKTEWLHDLCFNFGMPNVDRASMAEMQKFLIDLRGNKDTFEFHDELLEKRKEMEKSRPNKCWLYALGPDASEWERCLDEGYMCLGWEEIEDYSRFQSPKEIIDTMRVVYNKPKGRFTHDSLAVWNFYHEVKPGDVVYAKKGLYKIVGRGIVEGDYEYDNNMGHYPNIRKVKWTHVGEWETPQQKVQKTLTEIGKYPDYVKSLENLFLSYSPNKNSGHDQLVMVSDNARYWWLVATPKIYTFAGKPLGERQSWTLKNENGRKRKVFKDFEEAKVGDVVICYDANPTKQITGLAVVSKASDGESIEFQKLESLSYPVDLADIKANPELKEMKFVKSPMAMTFCSLTDDEADTLMNMIRERNPKVTSQSPSYTKRDFLNEVFMDKADYERLLALLLFKKNVVLQGAPGVGKTFTAKRLAYSILGIKDPSKVEMVQFHQNYSYEDFVMGYKPTEDGSFDLRNGVFYSFCKRAALDKENKYFFIIDEINRGNLSKIFGELLMLIENGYREKGIKLAYRDEEFAVPDNLYIIGMMNTADRSLAMIDYALRRRFSFFDINPGFDSEGFRKLQARIGNEKFDKVIEAVKALNLKIKAEASLGPGFCIGHSYFCLPEEEKYSEMWLQNIVNYDIEPMLREYWFDDPEKSSAEIAEFKILMK